MKTLFPLLLLLALASGCSVSKSYNPNRKLSPSELQDDYHLFRSILEESHPSLYWFTPKDSMDYYFDEGARRLTDSLTEYRFRYVLNSVLSRIRCGHTTVSASREASRQSDRLRTIYFPITVKAWDDTVVVTTNLNRKDSNLTRGVILRSIDGRPVGTILDSMFHHLSADGYNTTHKFQTVSNAGTFRTMYSYIFGVRPKTTVEYLDTSGILHTGSVNMGNLVLDSAQMRRIFQQPSKRERKQLERKAMRNFRIDSATRTGILEVNTFSKGNQLRGFFRRTFREVRKQGISDIVVDMRGNGGGSVVLSNLLTKYIADRPFKIADSLYAITNRSRYHRYQSEYFLNRLFFMFMTRRERDGHYHFRYFEGRYFKPRKRNHFRGTTYILTGGNTFSAASIFTKSLRDQDDVVVVGEETGGGAYGNTAWLIPDVTLPHSHLRFRLPLFRLVMDSTVPKGRGVMPEVEVKPTVRNIRGNTDFKLDKALELIRQSRHF